MKTKKALFVISFGSSIEFARGSIEKIEKHLASKYTERDFFRAFTSRFIIKKLKLRDGIHIDFPDEAIKKIHSLGYEDVVCQPLHVINGIEYELTKDIIKRYEKQFRKITLGAPLLNEACDYGQVAKLFSSFANEHSAILLMGHGTNHHSNSAYSMLEDMFRYKGLDNIYIATVEGFPEIDYAISKMKKDKVSKVTLMPFMIVAGDHAHNDMAGDDEDSWKSILLNEGFKVNTVLKGLGDYEEIAEIFCEHSKNAKWKKGK